VGILRAILLKVLMLHKSCDLEVQLRRWQLFHFVILGTQCSYRLSEKPNAKQAVMQQRLLSKSCQMLLCLVYLVPDVSLSTCLKTVCVDGFKSWGGESNVFHITDGCHFVQYWTQLPCEAALQLFGKTMKQM